MFRKNEIAPVMAGALPRGIHALVTRQVIGQENTVKAAIDCDRSLALATFLNDPQLSRVTPEDGEKMFDEMIGNTKAFLPKAWL